MQSIKRFKNIFGTKGKSGAFHRIFFLTEYADHFAVFIKHRTSAVAFVGRNGDLTGQRISVIARFRRDITIAVNNIITRKTKGENRLGQVTAAALDR